MSNTSTQLAYSAKGDGKAPLLITLVDRSRHIFVIGQTGTGKSTFLRNLVLQDIAHGRGFSFFDPHGQEAEEILDFIPPDRVEDTIYINPQDTENPIGFNLLQQSDDSKGNDLVVSSVIASLRQAWPDSWGPRMEHVLRNALYALLDVEGSTILNVPRLLHDAVYREGVTAKCTNPAVRHYWNQEVPNLTKRQWADWVSPVDNKIGYITSNSLLRNIFGKVKAKFNLVDVFNNQRNLIVNLAGIGAHEANFLGSLFVTSYHLSAMKRGQTEPAHNLYLDEVHRFSTPTLANMLSEIRKFGVSLTMAQQYMDQNEDEQVRKALLGNVGTLVVFRVAPKDARILSEAIDPDIVKGSGLTTLGLGDAFVRTHIKGSLLAERVTSRPNVFGKRHGRAKSIINDSQRAYGTPREKVEKRIERVFEAD